MYRLCTALTEGQMFDQLGCTIAMLAQASSEQKKQTLHTDLRWGFSSAACGVYAYLDHIAAS